MHAASWATASTWVQAWIAHFQSHLSLASVQELDLSLAPWHPILMFLLLSSTLTQHYCHAIVCKPNIVFSSILREFCYDHEFFFILRISWVTSRWHSYMENRDLQFLVTDFRTLSIRWRNEFLAQNWSYPKLLQSWIVQKTWISTSAGGGFSAAPRKQPHIVELHREQLIRCLELDY